jgi:Flp pilus assembly protein TadB
VIALLIGGFIGAMIVLYAADLIIKARARARRVRRMSARLDAAAARAEQQQEQRQDAARASRAMTSVLPAITRPPGDPAHRPQGAP